MTNLKQNYIFVLKGDEKLSNILNNVGNVIRIPVESEYTGKVKLNIHEGELKKKYQMEKTHISE